LSLHWRTKIELGRAGPGGRHWIRRTDQGADWLADPGWIDLVEAESGIDWSNLGEAPEAKLVKRGDSRSSWMVARPDGRLIFAKVTEARTWREASKRLLLGTRAEREARIAWRAAERGVGVLRPRAVGVLRGGVGVVLFEAWQVAVDLATAAEACGLMSYGVAEAAAGSAGNDVSDPAGAPGAPGAYAAGEARSLRSESRPSDQEIARGGQLIEAVAQLYARAHAAGFAHADGHPRNILVAGTAEDALGDPAPAVSGAGGFVAPQVRFVDVLGSLMWGRSKPRQVPMHARQASLAQLAQHFRTNTSATLRLRFFRAYLLAWAAAEQHPYGGKVWRRQFAAGVGRAVEVQRAKLAARRDRRLRGDGEFFGVCVVPAGAPGGVGSADPANWRGVVVLKLMRRHVFPELGVPDFSLDSWVDAVRSGLARDSSPEQAGELHVEGLVVPVTWFRPGSLGEKIAWWRRGSPAKRRFLEAHRRRHRDEVAPLYLGFLEDRRVGRVEAAVLLGPAEMLESAADQKGGA
jgi:hypothetical protein